MRALFWVGSIMIICWCLSPHESGRLLRRTLVLGVAAADATHSNVLIAGVAGLVAGAMSMAAGEYVSVHSQADTEQADIKRERKELTTDDPGERKGSRPRPT